MLDQQTLKEWVHYDPNTGVFTRLKVVSNRWQHLIGQPITQMDDGGYLRIKILGEEHRLHRLAWLYMTGEWPPKQIDHENRIKHDNRWSNLRLATTTQNACNAHTGRLTGRWPRGVYPNGSKWAARVSIHGKTMYLGQFDSIEAASNARRLKARELFGEFCME